MLVVVGPEKNADKTGHSRTLLTGRWKSRYLFVAPPPAIVHPIAASAFEIRDRYSVNGLTRDTVQTSPGFPHRTMNQNFRSLQE
jgi:hypothetical protein